MKIRKNVQLTAEGAKGSRYSATIKWEMFDHGDGTVSLKSRFYELERIPASWVMEVK